MLYQDIVIHTEEDIQDGSAKISASNLSRFLFPTDHQPLADYFENGLKKLGSSGQFNIELYRGSHKLGILDCLKIAKCPGFFRTQQKH